MLDQSFSLETFKEIFDRENRKGTNVEKLFKNDFSESLEQLKLIQDKTFEIRSETDKEAKKILLNDRKELKKEREALLESIIANSATDLHKKINDLTLSNGPVVGKQTYVIENTLENFFMSKKVQSNINRTYKVKQGNRYSILSHLANLLQDEVPKYVVRLDIKSFYESIPQKELLNKINDDYLLNALSKKFINKVFKEFNIHTGQTNDTNPKGIPRGVGISPYLSEIFMRSIDNEIRQLADVVYYERYVDDIIVIFVPKRKDIPANQLTTYKNELVRTIQNYGLHVNTQKTKSFKLLNSLAEISFRTDTYTDNTLLSKVETSDKSFDFLGYKFGSVKNVKTVSQTGKTKTSYSLVISLSENKINRYKEKVKQAFEEFHRKKVKNGKKALVLLESRVEFLTSNTKLRNNKSQVLIGVYYSNPFINDVGCLEKLDRSLAHYVGRSGLSQTKKNELKINSFKDGYNTRKFVLYPIKRKKYKHHNSRRNDKMNQTNNGIIRYGLKEINAIWKD